MNILLKIYSWLLIFLDSILQLIWLILFSTGEVIDTLQTKIELHNICISKKIK